MSSRSHENCSSGMCVRKSIRMDKDFCKSCLISRLLLQKLLWISDMSFHTNVWVLLKTHHLGNFVGQQFRLVISDWIFERWYVLSATKKNQAIHMTSRHYFLSSGYKLILRTSCKINFSFFIECKAILILFE